MLTAREKLAAVAAAVGYPPATLTAIAEAALPRYTAGERLAERQIDEITDAVRTLAQAGLTADEVDALIADHRHRHRHGANWRHALWRQALEAANRRYADQRRVAAAASGRPTPTGGPAA
jgi:hypothetical protein